MNRRIIDFWKYIVPLSRNISERNSNKLKKVKRSSVFFLLLFVDSIYFSVIREVPWVGYLSQ